MSPTLFLALVGLVCTAGFLVGIRFWRADEPLGGTPAAQVNRFGMLLMIANPFLFLFMLTLVLTGVAGPIEMAR